MTFPATSGSFTVAGQTFAFEVEADTIQRTGGSAGAEQKIPYGSVSYLQSAGPTATKLSFSAYFLTFAAFELLDDARGSFGTLTTVQDGFWPVARLDAVEKLHHWTDGSVDARLSFTCVKTAALGQVS